MFMKNTGKAFLSSIFLLYTIRFSESFLPYSKNTASILKHRQDLLSYAQDHQPKRNDRQNKDDSTPQIIVQSSQRSSDSSFTRRDVLQKGMGCLLIGSMWNRPGFAAEKNFAPISEVIDLPLQRCGGSFCTVYAVDGHIFRGVLDTGSPFITVPQSCSKMWGCYKGEYADAGLNNTIEIYASEEGTVEWRKGTLQIGNFVDESTGINYSFGQENIVFGILPNILVRYPGGVFVGLVKFKEDDIRPTFLGQTDFCALQFNFPSKNMQLSTHSLIPKEKDAVRFADLRPFGDPVYHYSTMARAVRVNGRQLDVEGELKPIYVIFDTGSTGMLLSKDLYYPAVNHARITGESYFGDVQVELETERGKTMTLNARSPLTTPFDVPWRNFKGKGHLVVLGLAFLENKVMTIDIDEERIVFDV